MFFMNPPITQKEQDIQEEFDKAWFPEDGPCRCGQKRLHVEQLPSCLVIDVSGAEDSYRNVRVKVRRHIPDVLTIRQAVYHLKAVIMFVTEEELDQKPIPEFVKIDDKRLDHVYAFVNRPTTESVWFYVNDSEVEEFEQFLSRNDASVLFYDRV